MAQMTADERDALRSELSELLQAEGMSEARMRFLAPNLIAYFNDQPLRDIKRSITEILDSGEFNKYKEALMFAFGFAGSIGMNGNLEQRREDERVSKHMDISDDTLRRWEKRGLEMLLDEIDRKSRRLGAGSHDPLDFSAKLADIQDQIEELKDPSVRKSPRYVKELLQILTQHQMEIQQIEAEYLEKVRAVEKTYRDRTDV